MSETLGVTTDEEGRRVIRTTHRGHIFTIVDDAADQDETRQFTVLSVEPPPSADVLAPESLDELGHRVAQLMQTAGEQGQEDG